ncbi:MULTISPECIES: e9imm peptide [unclassified Micromonospora]|uniref:e9imm peptide n=1 Tax=unclassified Micromonospora TaxID=2617518 RepID=UPI001C5E93D4|nr:e9imm peptide [Micromonospora sp. RL09-050-HVF-A]MBW4704051.1 e9imm peptide [Micromonospora sp. RL09-050-HVF-A]
MPAKLTRDEAVALVERIMRLDYADDGELNDWLDRLARDLVCPDVSDLIFTTTPELTATEVVDRALAYRPIVLKATPWSETEEQTRPD